MSVCADTSPAFQMFLSMSSYQAPHRLQNQFHWIAGWPAALSIVTVWSNTISADGMSCPLQAMLCVIIQFPINHSIYRMIWWELTSVWQRLKQLSYAYDGCNSRDTMTIARTCCRCHCVRLSVVPQRLLDGAQLHANEQQDNTGYTLFMRSSANIK